MKERKERKKERKKEKKEKITSLYTIPEGINVFFLIQYEKKNDKNNNFFPH